MRLAPMNRSRRTALRLLVGSGLVGLSLAPVQSGCATQTVTVSTRALERSGRASFVCLGRPDGEKPVLRPIGDCNATTVLAINDYTTTESDGGIAKDLPHLYALVTQTTRGEVAVIDTTSLNNYVLDQDPSVPGANFLPIGAQPVDIVSTPGATATFVGVAEVGREGLFALPSTRIRPANAGAGVGGDGTGGAAVSGPITLPEISAWPSCRLPAAPGQMLLLPDLAGKKTPSDKAATRPCCDADYGDPTSAKACQPMSTDPDAGAPSATVSGANGDIEAEGQGRQKLVVTLPSLGGVAVIDAQTLLDTAPGKYQPCQVERWLPLRSDVPALPPKNPSGGAACVDPETETPEVPATLDARPTTLAYAEGRLYASDLDTALIHVIDLPTPCEPKEVRPLLPTSLDDPKRFVTTTHVAVAPTPTPSLKRYLYAVDAREGSAMVFDVSDDQASQFPLQRPHPEWDPFTPSDRLVFQAPAADLLIVQRDVPESTPATGAAPDGLRCDPDPKLPVCLPTSASCNIATAYRTDLTTYASGAGPAKLRGTFAFLALTNGRIAVIDIDDYDAPCRGPVANSTLFGCPASSVDTDTAAPPLKTSSELSCNVVLPNTPRMGNYYANNQVAGLHQAGIQGYPQIFDTNGAPIDDTDPLAPRLVATTPIPGVYVPFFQLSVSGTPVFLDQVTGAVDEDSLVTKSTLMMNLEDPRAQLADQSWFATFEGPLPGFDQKLASLDLGAKSALRDAGSRFCDAGVQSFEAARAKLDPADPQSSARAAALADYVQLRTELPNADDRYWTSNEPDDHQISCTFNRCRTFFGSADVPAAGRDFTILEAYQDHVEIAPRGGASFPDTPSWQELTRCCFPSLVSFDIRVGNQWEVVGAQSGFLHHVIADPATGVCRDSCDPDLARKNGRALRVPNTVDNHGSWPAIHDGDPLAFLNPMFRFAVIDPPLNAGKTVTPARDLQFRFITQGAFKPLVVNLSADGSSLIQPVGMSFVPATGQLAVTDGSINGLLLVNLSSSAVARNFF